MATLEELVIEVDTDVAGAEKGLGSLQKTADKSFKSIEDSGDSIASMSEKADTAEQRVMGFRDTMTGVQDSMSGVSQIAKGDLFTGFLTLGMGIGDLASGFSNLLIPALGKAVTWLKATKVGMLAQAATTKIVSAATKVWTGIQAAFNFVMAMNPILLVVIAVVALIAVIIIAYKKSETFRKIVDAAFRWVLATVKTVWNWIRNNWKLLLAILTGPIGIAVLLITKYWGRITAGAVAAKNFIVNAFKGLGRAISAPFRFAFNAIRNAWNSIIGGRGFTVPDWIPGVGGKSFRIPRLAEGGIVTSPTLAMIGEGRQDEAVIPLPRGMRDGAFAGGGGTTHLYFERSGDRLVDALVEELSKYIRTRGGGNVQAVLGP